MDADSEEASMATRKRGNEREPLDVRDRPLDHSHTEAIPGCQEKLEYMRTRLERGVSLFHPNDKGIAENFRQIEDYDWNVQASEIV